MDSKIRRARVKCARVLVVLAVFALLQLGPSAFAQQAPESATAETPDTDIDQLYREGRFDEAIALVERSLSIQERALGPDHPGVVDALNNLAVLYLATGDYATAETLLERALGITREAHGPDDPASATTINNLGMLYWEQGDRDRAAQRFEAVHSIWERSLGPDHPKVAASLNDTASLYRKAGDHERAEPLYERAVAIWEGSSDPDHEQLANALRSLAAISQGAGDYARAEDFLKRALVLAETTDGTDDRDTAIALSNLASLYYDSRDYSRAEPLFERALSILERVHGTHHLGLLPALNNLAAVYAAMGNAESAVRLYERVIAIQSKIAGPDGLSVAPTLENLASLYQELGEYERSRQLYERVLAVHSTAHGPDSIAVARISKFLGLIQWELDDFAGAQLLFERALSIRKQKRDANHPVVAGSLNHIASVNLVRGHHAKARSLCEEALAIQESAFEPEHPVVAQLLRNLGLMHWANGDWDQAETYLTRAAEVEERQISLLLPVQFEDQVRAFMEELSNSTNLILSFQSRQPNRRSTTRLALATVLRRKGRELSVEVGELAALRRRLGNEERAVFEKLIARRDVLGRLVMRGSKRSRSESLRDSVDQLRREVDELEKAAASGGEVLRSWATPVQIDDLQSKIPAGAALVELVEYQDLDPTRISADRVGGTSRYAAFVLRAAGDPRWVPLGEAAAINESVQTYRGVLADSEVSPEKLRERARDLFDRLAAPLEPHLEGIQTVLVALDGAVALVPFGALIGPDGRYWVERYEFAYLTSGRDLLRPNSPLRSSAPPLVVAAPDYDAEHPSEIGAVGETFRRRLPENTVGHFAPAELSRTGALEVGRLLGVTPLTGAQASEAAIKAARAPRVLHIAADGFFLSDRDWESTARWGSILGIGPRLRPSFDQNPLLRSGLALAGANRRAKDEDRGLLTALESAGLDLWGTQLVAIAANGIESKRAAIGQATYALWRSLVIAGAESQFVNLWTTDHRAAAEMTTAYYQRLLAGEGRSEALRNVQLAMLRSENRSHPFYWASFISIGGARGPIAWADTAAAVEEVSGAP